MSTIFIALGSNIDPEKILRAAAEELRRVWPDIRFSSVYQTKAMGYEDQADFLNAVARFEANESPEEILTILQSTEKKLGKNPPFKNGPRTIDLDLLLHGDAILKTPALTIPHPGMHSRRFVLEPLCEVVDPSATHPVLKESWESLLKNTIDQSCTSTNIKL